MRIIWTKSTMPLSYLIRFITGEDCSHLALVFESRDGGLMFESNLLGTHPKFYKNAAKHFTIVHEMKVDATVEQEDAAWDLMVDQFDGKSYGFMAALYLAWRKILLRAFKSPMPMVNAWATDDTYFCDELYLILEHVGLRNIGIESGMQTPHDVWVKLHG
jgi:hypothetical protein